MLIVGEDVVVKGGLRLYRSVDDRRRAVAQFKKLGCNYFVGFRDTNKTHPVGLSYGVADWAGMFPYEKDINSLVH